jgi:opacity protein-like surface antigen
MNRYLPLTKVISGGLVACLAGLVAPSHLMAQDNTSDLRFGGMLSYLSPGGDLSSGLGVDTKSIAGTPGTKSGFGVTLFAEKIFSDNTAGRLRLEYLSFGKKKVVLGSETDGGANWHEAYEVGHTGSANVLAAMADWVFRVNSHDNGAFFSAGAGLMNVSTKYTLYDHEEWSYYDEHEEYNLEKSKSSSSFAVGLSLGLGYNFNRNFGIEARYTKGLGAKTATIAGMEFGYNDDVTVFWDEKSIDIDWIQVSVSWRF